MFFHVWLTESELKMFSLNIIEIDPRIRDEKAAEILTSTELNPHDFLKCRERNSGVNRDIIWRILRENKFHPYRM